MFFFGLSFVSDTGDWGRTPKSKINIMKNRINIGLAGFGNVGSYFYKILEKKMNSGNYIEF